MRDEVWIVKKPVNVMERKHEKLHALILPAVTAYKTPRNRKSFMPDLATRDSSTSSLDHQRNYKMKKLIPAQHDELKICHFIL